MVIEKGKSRNTLARKGGADLLSQHAAIRSQMRFLIKKLDDLCIPSSQEMATSTTLNEHISLYRYLLIDFKEAIRRHNESYERIKILYGGIINKEIIIEKRVIEKKLDNIISAANNAVYCQLRKEELNKCASNITEGVYKICESIEVHLEKRRKSIEIATGNSKSKGFDRPDDYR